MSLILKADRSVFYFVLSVTFPAAIFAVVAFVAAGVAAHVLVVVVVVY